jgi:hypothetical protein
MKIYKINDDSDPKILNILKSGITKDMFKNDRLYENYLYEYRDNPANLFYTLKNGRYSIGKYYIIADDDKYIASGGWYQYDIDTALLLTRMLVIPEYRSSYILGHTVLPEMIEHTKKYKNVWITFNDYNITLYKWFERVEQGKSGALFNNWPDVYRLFKPIGQKIVNNIPQYVVQLKDR